MCPATETFVGGAKGGGKSFGALGDWLKQMAVADKMGAQANGMFLRRSYTELDEVISKSKELFSDLGTWKDVKKTWEFPWGTLRMRYIERDQDAMRYQGNSLDWICFDELGNYPSPFTYNQMLSCLRSPDGVPTRMLATGNPGGPGQGWLKRRFIAGKKKDFVYEYPMEVNVKGRLIKRIVTRAFIPSSVLDNKYLMDNDPEYIARLAALPYHLRQAFLEGNWDVAIGQAFPELGERHRVEPFNVPVDWIRFATLDWGYVKPYSLGLWAWDPKGRLYRIGEDYGCVRGMEDEGVKMDASTAGRRFVDITNAMGISKIYADPAIWQRHGHGKTIAQLMQDKGLNVIPADRDRLAAKQTFHSMLQRNLDDGGPAFMAFSSCDEWWRTMPSLTSDPTVQEDVNTRSEDHQWDDTRFALMSPEVGRMVAESSFKRNYINNERDYAR
jgi:hypothetical protein